MSAPLNNLMGKHERQGDTLQQPEPVKYARNVSALHFKLEQTFTNIKTHSLAALCQAALGSSSHFVNFIETCFLNLGLPAPYCSFRDVFEGVACPPAEPQVNLKSSVTNQFGIPPPPKCLTHHISVLHKNLLCSIILADVALLFYIMLKQG